MSGTADPLLSRAVLIGTGRYQTQALNQIGAVHNNLTGLAEVLRADRFWGLSADRCVVVEDPVTTADMLDPVMTAAHAATDTLLLYYAGHGLVDPRRSELHLALTGSDPQRIYTAVPYAVVRDVLLDSRAVRRVVILDCCYSGRALGQMNALASAVADEASAEGSFVLAASAETKKALALPGERYTVFTGELLAIIHNGIAGHGPVLDLDTVYQHLLASMRSKGLPLPQKRDRNTAGHLGLIRNQAYRQPIAGLPPTGTTRTDGMPPGQSRSWSRLPSPSRRTIAVTAEWALRGKAPSDYGNYRLLEHSDGPISGEAFKHTITRYSPGTLTEELLPQVSVSWLPQSQPHRSYLAIAIHEYTKEGLLDAVGRRIIFTRYFCIPYNELAKYAISYEAIYEKVRDIPLPADGRHPIRIDFTIPQQPAHSDDQQASQVAALLLTQDPVCILGADQVSVLDRLRFIDTVMSMLPYGLRSQMSAATWTSSIFQHKFRLYFSNAPRRAREPYGHERVVSWGRPYDRPIGDHFAEDYGKWLHDSGDPAALLIRHTTPMSFSSKDILTIEELINIPMLPRPAPAGEPATAPTGQGTPAAANAAAARNALNLRTGPTANPAELSADAQDLMLTMLTLFPPKDNLLGYIGSSRPLRSFFLILLLIIGISLWFFTPVPFYVPPVVIAIAAAAITIRVAALYRMLTPEQRRRLRALSEPELAQISAQVSWRGRSRRGPGGGRQGEGQRR